MAVHNYAVTVRRHRRRAPFLKRLGVKPERYGMNNLSAVYAAGVPLLDFDLSSEISALETSEKRQAGRNARTLIKNENFRVVLVSLSAGAQVREHRANTPISIQILTGSVRFHTPEHTSVLPAGRLVVLDRGVLHDIEALEDSAFLLTFA